MLAFGKGPEPIWSYLLHWGLILFLIAWWFAWELYQWLATTRLSQLPEWLKRSISIGFTAGIDAFLALLIKEDCPFCGSTGNAGFIPSGCNEKRCQATGVFHDRHWFAVDDRS